MLQYEKILRKQAEPAFEDPRLLSPVGSPVPGLVKEIFS